MAPKAAPERRDAAEPAILEPSDAGAAVPREPEPDRWAAICALSWRPAWSIRNRIGALAPLIAWWRKSGDDLPPP